MAYEIFDDVAFYYMLCSIVALFLFPMAVWKAISFFKYLRSTSPHISIKSTTMNAESIQHPDDFNTGLPCSCPQCRQKKQLQLEANRGFSSYLTVSNIIFSVLLLIFLFLLTQLSSYNQSPLATYDPYQILGLPSGADASEIKKAYRQLSLKWHPDKNVENAAEAEKQFISINKAYQTLTSPQAQENIAKYGNPDGYQGISVTIGLPSFLTKKENELRVLFIYFLIFLVFPPVLVFLWWRRAKDFAESGVMVQSMKYFLWFIKPNYGVKYLVEILSSAEENALITNPTFTKSQPNQFYTDYMKLFALVKDSMVKQTFFDPASAKDPSKSKIKSKYRYVHIVSVIYHAYLQRVPIPVSLQPVLSHALKFAHPLLNSMLEAAIQRQMIVPLLGVIDLMQMLTQALWVHSSPLLQLPYLDEYLIKQLAKKNVKTIHALRKLSMEKRLKIISELTDAQWKEIDVVCGLFPDLHVSVTAGVEDEEDVYENDMVWVKAQLQRLAFDPEREEAKGRERLEEIDEEESTTNSNQQEKPNNTSNGKKKGEAGTSSSKDDKDDSGTPLTRKADIALDDPILSSQQLADLVPIPVTSKPTNVDVPPPLVHSPYFPYEKREKWVCFLFEMDPNDKNKPRQIVGFSRVSPLTTTQTVELRFKAPVVEGGGSKGWQQRDYTLHVMCDSYVGCDRSASFSLKIKKIRKDDSQANGHIDEKVSTENGDLATDDRLHGEGKEEEKSWLESLLHPDPNYQGKWYYFGLASFWELALNIVVMGLLCLFIFNYLHSRGYWQIYVQPTLDTITTLLQPVTLVLSPYISPVAAPVISTLSAVYAFVHSKVHVDPLPPLKRKKGNRGRADRIPVNDEDDEEMIARRREAEERKSGEHIPGMGIDDTTDEQQKTAAN